MANIFDAVEAMRVLHEYCIHHIDIHSGNAPYDTDGCPTCMFDGHCPKIQILNCHAEQCGFITPDCWKMFDEKK